MIIRDVTASRAMALLESVSRQVVGVIFKGRNVSELRIFRKNALGKLLSSGIS
jgi:hypothetical protein